MSKDKKQYEKKPQETKETKEKEESKTRVKLIAPTNMVGVLQLNDIQYLNGEIAELTKDELQTLKYGCSWDYEEVK
ncbi:hypothetical protein VBH15_09460 [Vagococcus fluvialis]|uniref:hypothetical protein n=1 Tax=Vagococcus fluvialis TaxID=2738 RepID=UPI0037CEE829